tara:strand:+ start:1703 stop:2104 length:402 start_codon:yes stop_codon:yes gene_type:complete
MEDESAKEDLEALEDVDEKGEADNVGEAGEAGETGEEGEETDTPTGEKKSLDLILDIPLTVTVELGRNKMLINDLLQLGQGSVIELKKLVGEPLEVLVNQKLVARGETVVVNEKFGVRLTDIVSPMERVKSLT